MGLLTALMNNVRERRQAELAFALNQREEAEARNRSEQAQTDRLYQSITSGAFEDALANGQVYQPPMMPGMYSKPKPPAARPPAPMAPEPPPAPRQSMGLDSGSLGKMLGKMKDTATRMGGGLLNRASSPDNRMR